MKKIILYPHKCYRCRHKWNGMKHPTICPNCKSPYWNRPRIGTLKTSRSTLE